MCRTAIVIIISFVENWELLIEEATLEAFKSITVFIIFILLLLDDNNHVNILLLKIVVYPRYICN